MDGLKSKKIFPGSDVILIHLESFYNIMYSYFNMGMLYIATLLRKEGYTVKCIDTSLLFYVGIDELEQFIKRENPRLIGFYTIADNIYPVRDLAVQLKNWVPSARIVLGGPQACVQGKELLKDPVFDIVGMGEGEYIMRELADYYCRGIGNLKNIKGIIYKDMDRVIENPPREPIANLDALPYPDFDLVGAQYGFHIVTGRGCPFGCVFCFQGVHGRGYRFRSAESVTGEIIANLKKYPVSHFEIVDDTFIVKAERGFEIANILKDYRKETGRDYVFYCEGRVDILEKNPKLIQSLKDAGLARVQIGIESGDQRILDLYKKKITPELIKDAVKTCADIGGISICGNFILGGPGETEESFQKSLALVKELIDIAPGYFECSTSLMCPYPGTMITEHPLQFGVRILDREFKKGLTLSYPTLETDACDVNTARNWEKRFDREVGDYMKSKVPEIPQEVVEQHFRWARNYQLNTFWFLNFFSKSEAMDAFTYFLSSARFRKLNDIPERDFPRFYPTRTLGKCLYSEDGKRLMLPNPFNEETLDSPVEIAIYEYSAGKITAAEIAKLIKEDLSIPESPDNIMEKILIPFYGKMEKGYYMTFYR